MTSSLSKPARKRRRGRRAPADCALLLVLLVDSTVAPTFLSGGARDGRLFGSPIDILNRAAPVALLAVA